MNHESLIWILEHLRRIPISQIEEDQRSCGICWETFISIAPDPDGPSSGQHESTVSASNYTLEKTTPFPVHASTSTSHVAAKTETCVEREMLPEMCTDYQRRQQGEGSGSGGSDDLGRLRALDDPLQMQCGHTFGRNCLRSW